ncbi:hypothetical protein [Ralstonia phage RP13]|nr:hypothetical protein [Ralstonia phage RP13]
MATARSLLNKIQSINESLLDDKLEELGVVKDTNATGFSDKEQKWYGWSHRGYCGFGIGDKIFDASLLPESISDTNEWSDVPFNQLGTKDIESLDDAKIAAQNFAEYIG